jgi:hypothetical protein
MIEGGVVEGGWAYVWGAYALALGGLGALAAIVAVRAAYWARQARALDKAKS